MKLTGGRLLSICFVVHNGYGAMTGEKARHIGGIERQQSLMARWLVGRGHQVSMLTWDEGQPDHVVLGGVHMFKLCRRDAGLPGLRFIAPRWTSLCRGLRRADAQLYYHNAAEYVTGQVAAWSRLHGRKFVYSVASDPDCDPALPQMSSRRERWLYRYGLSRADRVIVQTQTQHEALRRGFGVKAVVIPMPCVGPGAAEYRDRAPPQVGAERVLWVGRIADEKRLELLLEVARALPEVAFDVAGGAGADLAYYRGAIAMAEKEPNVKLHGRLEAARLSVLYRQAFCLCCTSAYEGFPNTFLEAWSHGLPVVSTVDPDGLISQRKLGTIATDAAGLTSALRTLLARREEWCEMSRNARQYYASNHTVEEVMPRFEELFLETAGCKSRSVETVEVK